jgi:hypothetical protein
LTFSAVTLSFAPITTKITTVRNRTLQVKTLFALFASLKSKIVGSGKANKNNTKGLLIQETFVYLDSGNETTYRLILKLIHSHALTRKPRCMEFRMQPL